MVVAVASPPPSAGRSHPTYKEMVVQALTESGGSSRRAISKYIADHFSGLPARHDALLSVHLRRLSSQGLLHMSGCSYLIRTAPDPVQKRGPGRPRKSAGLSSSAPFQGIKRGPGRPRANRVAAASSAPPLQGVKRGPGRPPKNAAPVAASGVKRGPGRPRKNTVPVSVPHNSMPAGKRGRGRPPKNAQILDAASGAKGMPQSVTLVATATIPALKRGPGRPSRSAVTGVRRGRGRPPKVLLPAYSSIPFPEVPSLVAGIRKRGRPPKEKRLPSQPELVQSVALTTRGHGRPRKERSLGGSHLKAGVEAQPQAADHAGDMLRNGGEVRYLPSSSTASTQKRGCGRPRKRPLETKMKETGVTALAEKRRPGRPRKKNYSAQLSMETEGIAISGSKRGRGRPRKEKPLAGASAETGIAASMGNKRGRGRPRKENPSVGASAETEIAASMGNKRGCGRPRKENPLAGASVETGIAASMGNKRGRGRPRKENPSAGASAETGSTASVSNKRGRGRPRKDVSFGIESEEAAVEVSRDLAESKPKKDDTSVSGNTTETGSVLSGERMEVRPPGAGELLVSGEKASTTYGEAEGATLVADPIVSNLDNGSVVH